MEEVGQESQVKEAEVVEEGELAPQVLKLRVEAQTAMPVQHGQRTHQQVELQTENAGGRKNCGDIGI